MPRKVVLIDGANILHRAYFAAKIFNPNLTADNAIELARSMLLKNLRELNVEAKYCLMAGEGSGTWRRDIFPDYKKGRHEKDEVLVDVLSRGYHELTDTGIKLITIAGFEADDVLATYADLLDAEFYETVIVTGDKDLLQCVTGTTSVRLLRQSGGPMLYRPSDFSTEYGFAAPLFPDYKSLLGDKSDAIPGVDQIGEKRGRQLVSAYGRLDKIYARADDAPEGVFTYTSPEPMTALVRGYLLAGREIAFRNIELMRVRRDVPGVELKGR